MVKSLQQYKDDLHRQWEKPTEPTVSAPYFTFPNLAAKWRNLPVEAFKGEGYSVTLTYPLFLVGLAVAACVVAMALSGAELWGLVNRHFVGKTGEPADEFVVLVLGTGILVSGLAALQYVRKIRREKISLTFSNSSIQYVFWTKDGDVELSAAYNSFKGVHRDHTEFQNRNGDIEHAYSIILEHPNPVLSLTLFKVTGEFDERLCHGYADAIGVPVLEVFKG
ncbi:hypothetical protein [Pyruvatibacter sp.]|uniref:hypothetical protein n=1 Tax=Pyruvatibacter sp. TaxID=1981328 RepID=UPI00326695CE